MKIRLAVPIVASLCVAFSTPQTIVRSQTVFRSGVQYVAVDVIVTNHNDRPVTDLKADEFHITEEGKTQKISDFQYVSVPLAHRLVDVTAATAAPEPEPDVASNAAPKPDSRLFVLVIDDLHIIEQELIPVKRLMTDFLRGLAATDEVAVVYVNRSDLSINFTSNTSRVLQAIDHLRGALGMGLDALAADRIPGTDADAGPSNARRSYGNLRPSKQRLPYALSTLTVLRNVANSLADSSHARRTMVLVSGGSTIEPFGELQQGNPQLQVEQLTYRDELLKTYDIVRRAGVPIYTLDPRGGVLPEDAVRGGIGMISSPGLRGQVLENIRIQQNTLSTIAVNTGGRALMNASDLTRAVNDIVQENGSYYLLGYYPEPLIADGKFHEVKVRVTRPGTRVRARAGYVAPGGERANTTTAAVLETAMSSGVNVSGLPIRVFAAPLASAPKGMTTAVTVEVTYPAPLDGSRRIDDNIELSIVAIDADAKVKARASRPMKFSGTVPSTGAITFLMDDVILLPSQPLTLRVGVASQTLGKAGTSQIAIDVPKPSDDRLQMSAVALGFSGAPRQAVMNASLIAQLLPFQPTTTRTFSPRDRLRLFARLFWKGAGQPVATVTITGQAAPRTLTLSLEDASNGRREAVLDATQSLGTLPAGRHELVISAQLPNGQSTKRVIVFEVN